MIEALGRVPRSSLVAGFELKVSTGEVVADGIAEYHAVGFGLGDIRATFSQRHDQLNLVMQVRGPGRIGHIAAIGNDGVRRLREEKGRLAIGIHPHLAGMRRIIAGDAIDTVDRKALSPALYLDRGSAFGFKKIGHLVCAQAKASSKWARIAAHDRRSVLSL